MKVGFIALTALVCIWASMRGAYAEPSHSFGRKALCAESAVEIHMEAEPRHHEKGDRPVGDRDKAFASARIVRVVFSSGPVRLPSPLYFRLSAYEWADVWERRFLHAILFMRQLDGVPVVLFGGEGVRSDASPGYRETRSAVMRFARWHAGGNGAAAVADAEKLLAGATNDDVAELARDYLCSRKEAASVERAWKLAPPGSSAAAQRDNARNRNEPVCRPLPDNCSVW